MLTLIETKITAVLTTGNKLNIIGNVPVKDFAERLSVKSAKRESSGA